MSSRIRNSTKKKLTNTKSSASSNTKPTKKMVVSKSTAKKNTTPKSTAKKNTTPKSTVKKTTTAKRAPKTSVSTTTTKRATRQVPKSVSKKTTTAKRAPKTSVSTTTTKRVTTSKSRSATAKGTPKNSKTVSKAKGTKTESKRTKSNQNWTICLSHKEDLDGISAAALIKQAHGGDTVLTDYPSQMPILADLASDVRLKKLFICDLGLSKKNQDEFINIMSALRKRRVSVTYIDHHSIEHDVAKQISNLGVKLIHDTNECASVLVYKTFKSKLAHHATFVASCAAITDYMEDRPIASELLQIYDRQFALISATVMTYNIVGHQKENDYLMALVDALAESKFPHEIPNSFVFAREQVEKLSEIIAKVKAGLKKMQYLAHMEITDAGASGAVNFVLGMSGKDVGIAYKAKKNDDFYAVSVRGSKSCTAHLGKIVNILATELGGSGGGHDKACGAVIPLSKIRRFVSEMNKRIAIA